MTGYKNIKKEVSVIVGLITYEFEAIISYYLKIEDGDNETPSYSETFFVGAEIVRDIYAYDDSTGDDYLVTSDFEMAEVYSAVDWEDEMNEALIF